MPKSSLSLEERIAKLEQEKEQLIQKRKNEIAELFTKHKAITIDNKVILGLIKHYQAVVKDGKEKDDGLLNQLRSVMAKSSSPSQRLKPTEQSA